MEAHKGNAKPNREGLGTNDSTYGVLFLQYALALAPDGQSRIASFRK